MRVGGAILLLLVGVSLLAFIPITRRCIGDWVQVADGQPPPPDVAARFDAGFLPTGSTPPWAWATGRGEAHTDVGYVPFPEILSNPDKGVFFSDRPDAACRLRSYRWGGPVATAQTGGAVFFAVMFVWMAWRWYRFGRQTPARPGSTGGV